MKPKKTLPSKASARFTATAIEPPDALKPIAIKTHRELFAKSREMAERVRDNPEFSVMFLSNPVLALEAYGIKLSPELRHHVMDTLRHPPKLRARRAELEASLEEALGEKAKPTDEAWMADLVFRKRKIEPRDIGSGEPAYKPALNAASVERLQKARPKATKRYSGQRRSKVQFSLTVAPPSNTLRRMDLDADVPDMKPAAKAPKSLTLEEAWFYKDDAIVKEAVELGQIMRRGFPFRTPAEFRAIAKGEKVDAFRRFVRAVRIREVTQE